MSSIPGWGTKILHAMEQLSLHAVIIELWALESMLHNERRLLAPPQVEKALPPQQRPRAAKIKKEKTFNAIHHSNYPWVSFSMSLSPPLNLGEDIQWFSCWLFSPESCHFKVSSRLFLLCIPSCFKCWMADTSYFATFKLPDLFSKSIGNCS